MLDRNYAMGLRRGNKSLSEEEVELIKQEIERIKADAEVFSIDRTDMRKQHIVR